MPDSKDLKDLDSQLKKTIISAESFKRGSSVDPSKNILNLQKTLSKLVENVRSIVNLVSDLGNIVNNNSRKITILIVYIQLFQEKLLRKNQLSYQEYS